MIQLRIKVTVKRKAFMKNQSMCLINFLCTTWKLFEDFNAKMRRDVLIKTANKSSNNCSRVLIFGNNGNKSKWYSWRSKGQIKCGECLLPFSSRSVFPFLTKTLLIKIYKNIILPSVLNGHGIWYLILWDEQRLGVYKNKVLRGIYSSKDQ